jgi:protein subunit release factor A
MELIYFILGFLFTVTGYGIVLLHKTKSSHTALLEEITLLLDHIHTFEESIKDGYEKTQAQMHEISGYYNKIQRQMEDDKYSGMVKINERITEVTELFNEQGNRNKRLFDMADKQLRQNQNEIQQANNTLKKIIDDPTTLARY